MKSYPDKLRDPRWQKKRLEVMERDGFACRNCGAKDKTLHVHHCYYEYGKEPWEYRKASLLTLCDECHEKEKDSKGMPKSFVKQLQQIGFTDSDFAFLDLYLCISVSIGNVKNDIFQCLLSALYNLSKKDQRGGMQAHGPRRNAVTGRVMGIAATQSNGESVAHTAEGNAV